MPSLLSILVWTGASFTVTILMLLPARLNATEPKGIPDSRPAKLLIDQCEVYVRVAGDGSASSQVTLESPKPVLLELVAVNPTERQVTITPSISLSLSRFASPAARVISAPIESWRSQESIALAPGETKVVKLAHPAEVLSGMSGVVILSSPNEAVASLRLQNPAR